MRTMIFAACLLWVVTASAQMLPGNLLLEGLKLRGGYAEGVSQGYISGVIDSARVLLYLSPNKLCLPDGVKYPQIWAVVEKYVKDHPERLHQTAFELIMDAIKEAWPCTNK